MLLHHISFMMKIIVVILVSLLASACIDRKAFQLYKQKQVEPLEVNVNGFYGAVADYLAMILYFFIVMELLKV